MIPAAAHNVRCARSGAAPVNRSPDAVRVSAEAALVGELHPAGVCTPHKAANPVQGPVGLILTTGSPVVAAKEAEANSGMRQGNGEIEPMDQPLPLSARRILLVAPQPFYEDRGTPIAVRQVLEALSELGHEVDLLTYPVGTPVHIEGVRVFRTSNPFRIRHVPIGLSLRKVVLDMGLLRLLLRRLRHERYDCIHAVEEAAFAAVWVGRARGIPVLYDMQSSLPEQLAQYRLFRVPLIQRFLRSCEAWLLRRASGVISSAGLAHRVRETAPETEVREWTFAASVAEVADAERTELRRELQIPRTHRVVLYMGSFESYQGLGNLLASVPQVLRHHPETTFVLAGAPVEACSALKEQGRQAGVDAHLRILPRQPRDRVRIFLSVADVLVSPRLYGENLPLKIFEYLAAGRPIVATDIATHRGTLTDDRAILVAPDPEGLARGIGRVLEDPELAARLGAEAAGFALRHFGWDRFVHDLSQAYGQVLEPTPVPEP